MGLGKSEDERGGVSRVFTRRLEKNEDEQEVSHECSPVGLKKNEDERGGVSQVFTRGTSEE